MKLIINNRAYTSIIDKVEDIKNELNLKDSTKYKVSKIMISLYCLILNKQFNQQNIDFYVNISKDILSKFRIKIKNKDYHYTYFLNKLEEASLIDINNSYSNFSNNKFSKGYRVKFFEELSFVWVDIDFKIFDNFKDKEYYLKKYSELKNAIEDIYSVDIDLDAYIEYLIINHNNICNELLLDKKISKKIVKTKILQYIHKAILFKHKRLWITVSDEGRLYSSLTNLNKIALPFLSFNKEKLVEADVVNCQPLLLSSLIDNVAFSYDVEAGHFYDKLALVMNKTRDDIKLLLYRYVFFNNNQLKSGDLYNTLELLYPNLITQINKIKENSLLFEKLQNKESDIFIKGILKNTDRFCVTRHDSIMCLEKDKDYFTFLIKKEFEKINLNVRIK